MNIGGRKAKWYADFDSLWTHFKDVHHKKATQAAMILHLADRWAQLSDTHRESGLGWCLQYFDNRPAEHSTWGSNDEAVVLNPRAILGTTGVSLPPELPQHA
eukprot:6465818-Amphidinium_carterae.2